MVDTRCGWGPLKDVGCLQMFANLKVYAFVSGLITLGITSAYTYMSSVQSTTQSVYSFSATDIGIWYAMFEVGSVLSNVFASYFLTNKHIPRVLTFGLVMMVAGCVMHGLPHFFISYEDRVKSTGEGKSEEEHVTETLCDLVTPLFNNLTSTTTTTTTTTELPAGGGTGGALRSTIVIIMYCFGGFLMGAGYAPYWSLSFVFIDNNVKELHGSSKYIAVILAFYTIGPVVGFGSGALFLSNYVTLGETYLTPDDPQWIGAWWIGYFVFGAFMAAFLLPMSCFPKRLPWSGPEGTESAQSHKKMSTTSSSSQADIIPADSANNADNNEFRSAKDLLPTLGKLFLNPLYVTETLAACAGVYYLSGWIGFLPKYFEVQFFFSAWEANIFAGLLPPLLSCFAIFLGGWVASKYKLTLQQDAKFIFFCSFSATILLIPTIFLTCPQSQTQPVPDQYMPCITDCACSDQLYTPVCYNGVSYRSPCAAGCQRYEKQGEQFIYHDCFCSTNVTMTGGSCTEGEKCLAPYFYVACAVISMATFVACSSSGVNIIMRSVAEEDKSIALGIQSSMTSLLAWIPAPILYGVVIDSTCNIWEYPGGSEEDPDWWGYCMEYDNNDYRYKYELMTIGMTSLMTVFAGAGWAVSQMERYQSKEPVSSESDVKLDDL